MVPDLDESAPSATTMTLLEKWSGVGYFTSKILTCTPFFQQCHGSGYYSSSDFLLLLQAGVSVSKPVLTHNHSEGCLKIHEDSIHKNTRFSCQYCGKQYAQNPEEEQPDCTHK